MPPGVTEENCVIAGLVGIGRDVSERKKTEASPVESQEALRLRSQELEEMNSALKIILLRREANKMELEEQVTAKKHPATAHALHDQHHRIAGHVSEESDREPGIVSK